MVFQLWTIGTSFIQMMPLTAKQNTMKKERRQKYQKQLGRTLNQMKKFMKNKIS
jgi:hypothetical protein